MIVTPPRMMYYIPIQGYRHMYRSLMRYFGMNRLEVSSLLFPLYLVFAVGSAISLVPMLYMSFHPRVREFILNNG